MPRIIQPPDYRHIMHIDCKLKAKLSPEQCKEWSVTPKEQNRAKNYLDAIRVSRGLERLYGKSEVANSA